MKILEMNKKNRGNINGLYLENYSYLACLLSLSIKLDIKVMVRHFTLTLWSDMKIILFVYS